MAEQLVHHIKQLGPNGDFDINNLTMRYSMDVTGLVGFAKDFGTCRTFDDASTDELFDILRAGELIAAPARCLLDDSRICRSTNAVLQGCNSTLARLPPNCTDVLSVHLAGMLECYSRAINPFRRLMIWNPVRVWQITP